MYSAFYKKSSISFLFAEHCEEPWEAGGEGLALLDQGPPHGGEEGKHETNIIFKTEGLE